MSGTTIIDGTGTGVHAKVNKQNRIQTLSVSENIAAHHAFEGDAFNINTGTVSLGSTTKSAVLYLKNNEDDPLVITALFYLLGNNTGGGTDENHLVQVERNPTGGTLVSSGTNFSAINRNFGSAKVLDADIIKMDTAGRTLIGGTVAIESIFTGEGRQALSVGAVIINKGDSIGITITPQASTTAMDVQMAIACYRATELTV